MLGISPAVRLLLYVGAPALGLALGYFLPRIADWALTLPWVPMGGPLRLIASFEGPWALGLCVVAGLVLGLGLAFVATVEALTVTLTDSQIRLRKDQKSRTIERSDVDAVFVDAKLLVVLDRESRQLVRERHESTAAGLERAFRAHGYPWVERDPYGELYRRWVPDTPEVPPAVNAVLRAREVALQQKVAKDVTELRDEVQKLGFVVRDEGVGQYWRPLVRS